MTQEYDGGSECMICGAGCSPNRANPEAFFMAIEEFQEKHRACEDVLLARMEAEMTESVRREAP